jgi:multidrug resistance efflux pump
MKKAALPLLALLLGGAVYYYFQRSPASLVLTGIVTTNDVVVSPQIAGRIGRLLVNEGDAVQKDQLVAVIDPGEMKADISYYTHSTAGLADQVVEAAAALRYQQQQTADQIRQAEATEASAEAQQAAATADVENARLNFERSQKMSSQGIVPVEQFDQARTAYDGARARLDSLRKQVEAARASVALARSNAEQIAMRRSQLQANEHQAAAAAAQKTKADVRFSYTELHAPIAGVVDVRPVRVGEVVVPGQPVLTLINPDDLWVRADVEETYIDRVRLGDKLTVRLPSGEERQGAVFYRGADAGFATQRDVSRTKRDIKTFEVRLRCDNTDRRLAVGMTAYVLLPVS